MEFKTAMTDQIRPFGLRLARVLGAQVRVDVDRLVIRSLEQARRHVEEVDTISIDFFDTLITRCAAYPDAVQHYVGHLMQEGNPRRIDFFVRRKQAEDRARIAAGPGKDVTLKAIYAAFERDADWDDEAIGEAMRCEGETDRRSFVPRAPMIEMLRHAKAIGKRTIIVSDSYFSTDFISDYLKSIDVDQYVDHIYVSSDVDARKDSGTMWDLIRARETTDRVSFLHIGDNIHSDIGMAQSRALKCAYVPAPVVSMRLRGLNYCASRRWSDDLLFGPLCARFGNDPFQDPDLTDRIKIDNEKDLGYFVFGPILLEFVSWLITHPTLAAIDSLFFASREGYFLKKLYDALKTQAGLDRLPRSQYLYTSRPSVILAAQVDGLIPDVIIGNSDFRGSLSEFLAGRIGFANPDISGLLTDLVLPPDRAGLERALNVCAPGIVDWAKDHSDAFLAYYRQAGLTESTCAGIVDIGYSATIQKGLKRIIGQPLVGLYLATSVEGGKLSGADGFSFGCIQDGRYQEPYDISFMPLTVVLEALLTAPHGQVAHFEFDDHGVAGPVFAAPGRSQSVFPQLELIFDGVLNYCLEMLQAYGPPIFRALAHSESLGLLPLRMLVEGQLAIDQNLVDLLSLEDRFTGRGDISIVNRFPILGQMTSPGPA